MRYMSVDRITWASLNGRPTLLVVVWGCQPMPTFSMASDLMKVVANRFRGLTVEDLTCQHDGITIQADGSARIRSTLLVNSSLDW